MEEIKGLHLGEVSGLTDEELTFCQQMGVEYIHIPYHLEGQEKDVEGGHHTVESLTRSRERVESFDLKIGAVGLPSSSVVRVGSRRGSSIILGAPERDRDIENICKSVEAVGKTGIPLLMWGFWGFHTMGLLRNPGITLGKSPLMYSHRGRGGAIASAFDYEVVKNEPPAPAAPITAEESWERIEYAVKRVIPVAEEYKVKMACHPNDVPVPPGTSHRGIAPILNNVEGLKRYIELYPSPYHGLVFCQGCVAETSTNAEQVYDAIRYFGKRKKIFWVHFRNIRGGLGKFEEAFPDEGDIDMLKAIHIYKEVGYNGVLVPDHVPLAEANETGRLRSYAFALGYMRALIQAVESEK